MKKAVQKLSVHHHPQITDGKGTYLWIQKKRHKYLKYLLVINTVLKT